MWMKLINFSLSLGIFAKCFKVSQRWLKILDWFHPTSWAEWENVYDWFELWFSPTSIILILSWETKCCQMNAKDINKINQSESWMNLLIKLSKNVMMIVTVNAKFIEHVEWSLHSQLIPIVYEQREKWSWNVCDSCFFVSEHNFYTLYAVHQHDSEGFWTMWK